jgi:hypothetical protein
MTGRKRPALALVVAALAMTASGYAATSGVHGIRSSNRPSSTGNGNGHCGHSTDKPPCGNASGQANNNSRSGRG